MKPFFTLLLTLISLQVIAQDCKYEMSDEVDLPQAGWNKVLMMRNGNTMLFHFELRKGIIVKVFNKDHKEIASQKHICDILDINQLDRATLEGVYEISGEAVLFFTQIYHNHLALIRIRINAENGRLIEEKPQLTGMSYQVNGAVLRQKDGNEYYVQVSLRSKQRPFGISYTLLKYNNKHELVDSIAIPVSKNYDKETDVYTDNTSNAINSDGSIYLTSYSANVFRKYGGLFDTAANKRQSHLNVLYLPKNGNKFIETKVDLNYNLDPLYTLSSYDTITKQINILLRYPLPLLCSVNPETQEMRKSWLWGSILLFNNKDKEIDSAYSFLGFPFRIYNKKGITTVISQRFGNYSSGDPRYPTYASLKNFEKRQRFSQFGDMQIQKFNNKGEVIDSKEIWVNQYAKTEIFYTDIVERGAGVREFKFLSRENYISQFFSFNAFVSDKMYIVYNHPAGDFNSAEISYNPVTEYSNTDGCYYSMDQGKTLIKKRLFGPALVGEASASLLDGADFDDKTNTYAALTACRKGKDVTLKMAWCHLE